MKCNATVRKVISVPCIGWVMNPLSHSQSVDHYPGRWWSGDLLSMPARLRLPDLRERRVRHHRGENRNGKGAQRREHFRQRDRFECVVPEERSHAPDFCVANFSVKTMGTLAGNAVPRRANVLVTASPSSRPSKRNLRPRYQQS